MGQANPQGESMDSVDKKALDFLTAQWSSKNQAVCWLVSWENGKFNRGENETLGRTMEQSGKHLKCACPSARIIRAKQEAYKALVHIPSYELISFTDTWKRESRNSRRRINWL